MGGGVSTNRQPTEQHDHSLFLLGLPHCHKVTREHWGHQLTLSIINSAIIKPIKRHHPVGPPSPPSTSSRSTTSLIKWHLFNLQRHPIAIHHQRALHRWRHLQQQQHSFRVHHHSIFNRSSSKAPSSPTHLTPSAPMHSTGSIPSPRMGLEAPVRLRQAVSTSRALRRQTLHTTANRPAR